MNTSPQHRTLPLCVRLVIVFALGCAETVTPTNTDASTADEDDRADGADASGATLLEGADASADRVETPPSFCDPSPCPGRVCCEVFRTCFPPGTACPGDPPGMGPYACLGNADCRVTEYCQHPDCSASGRCVERPTQCMTNVPVCGCDQTTYVNVCNALVWNVRIQREGACVPSPPPTPPGECQYDAQCHFTDRCCHVGIGRGRCVLRNCQGCCHT